VGSVMDICNFKIFEIFDTLLNICTKYITVSFSVVECEQFNEHSV
jgi:hypothetical protein